MDFSKVEHGVNSQEVANYLNRIQSDVINEAAQTLYDQYETLCESFRANWKGQAEQNFEHNFGSATRLVQQSLWDHYNALSEEIYAVNNGWVQQDEEMVDKIGGGF